MRGNGRSIFWKSFDLVVDSKGGRFDLFSFVIDGGKRNSEESISELTEFDLSNLSRGGKDS